MANSEMLRKPLLGGVFGQGEYELATQAIVSAGLHAVRFSVLEPRAGRVLSIAETKVEALSAARRLLTATSANEPTWIQPRLWSDAELHVVPAPSSPRPISRRRREIFERSGGACFYCNKVLTLDGNWHIEHQRPRALGGDDSLLNLVAACEPCNLAKGDRTALEFLARPQEAA